jgi:hypothetical protein
MARPASSSSSTRAKQGNPKSIFVVQFATSAAYVRIGYGVAPSASALFRRSAARARAVVPFTEPGTKASGRYRNILGSAESPGRAAPLQNDDTTQLAGSRARRMGT